MSRTNAGFDRYGKYFGKHTSGRIGRDVMPHGSQRKQDENSSKYRSILFVLPSRNSRLPWKWIGTLRCTRPFGLQTRKHWYRPHLNEQPDSCQCSMVWFPITISKYSFGNDKSIKFSILVATTRVPKYAGLRSMPSYSAPMFWQCDLIAE